MLYSDAKQYFIKDVNRLYAHGKGWRLLRMVPKRRLKPLAGKRRRKYWYVRQEDFDHIVQLARATVVERAMA